MSVKSEGEGFGCTFSMEIPLPDGLQQNSNMMSNGHIGIVHSHSVAPLPCPVEVEVEAVSTRATLPMSVPVAAQEPSSSVVELFQREDTQGLDSAIPVSSAVPSSVSNGVVDVNGRKNKNVSSIDVVKTWTPLRILVVDDVRMNRKMMTRVIKLRQESVVEAEDGQEALTLVLEALSRGEPFDFVLMDYQMPVMDGPTSASQMRLAGYKGTIIGVTGNALKEDIAYFIAHGADR